MKKLLLIVLFLFSLSACSKKYTLAGGYVHRDCNSTAHDTSLNQNYSELQETAAKIAENLDLETEDGVAAYAWQMQEVLVNLGLVTEGYLPIRAIFYSDGIGEIQLTPDGIVYPDVIGDGVFYLHYEYDFVYFLYKMVTYLKL